MPSSVCACNLLARDSCCCFPVARGLVVLAPSQDSTMLERWLEDVAAHQVGPLAGGLLLAATWHLYGSALPGARQAFTHPYAGEAHIHEHSRDFM